MLSDLSAHWFLLKTWIFNADLHYKTPSSCMCGVFVLFKRHRTSFPLRCDDTWHMMWWFAETRLQNYITITGVSLNYLFAVKITCNDLTAHSFLYRWLQTFLVCGVEFPLKPRLQRERVVSGEEIRVAVGRFSASLLIHSTDLLSLMKPLSALLR